MKRVIQMVFVAIMVSISAQAQKIQVVDADGNAIPLVSVLTEDGVLIGTTDISGTLTDVKGATKVVLTHVAYKTQLVSVASLTDGRVGRGRRQAQALSLHGILLPRLFIHRRLAPGLRWRYRASGL